MRIDGDRPMGLMIADLCLSKTPSLARLNEKCKILSALMKDSDFLFDKLNSHFYKLSLRLMLLMED